MTVTDVRKDTENLTMTVDADFEASPDRVWQLWADPRQLERWWGPPTYPATVTTHDLRAGGRVEYHMTGPEGDQPRGYWEIVEVAAAEPARLPRRLRRRGRQAEHGPARSSEVRVTIAEIGGGTTRMSIESIFPDLAAMEQVLAMGMEAGPDGGPRPDRRHPCRGPFTSDRLRRRPQPTLRQPQRTDMTTMTTSSIEMTTHTLDVPGATLTYDVRRSDASTEPPLLLIGSADGRRRASSRWPGTSPTARS